MARAVQSRAGRTHKPLVGLVVVGLGASLAPMDLAVNVAFPAITAAFALETRAIRWLVICYVLAYSSLLLAFGGLGDRIGHRRVFRAGLLVSVVAFALCALAPDYRWLLVARIAQGIATALVLSCAPALATLLFEESQRTKTLGAYAGMAALASIVAPLIGGASIALLGWSGVFWFRVPVALLALLLLPLIPELQQPSHTTSHRTFDLSGSFLLAISLAMLLLAPALLHSAVAPWIALLTALAGVAVFTAFTLHQRHVPEPILPIAAIRDPEFVLPNVASVAVHFVAFAVPLLVPYYLTRIGGYSSIESGIVLALSPAGNLLGSTLAVSIARRAGTHRTALFGGALAAVGSLTIAFWPLSAALPLLAASLLLQGTGVGLFQLAYSDIVVATLPRQARGVAGSLTMVTRTFGVVTAATALTAAMAAAEHQQLAAGETAIAAFLNAFNTVFLYSAGALAVLFALSCLRRRP